MAIPLRALGTQGLKVPAIGLGCMTMTAFYEGFDRNATIDESLAAIDKALELGCNFLDTAWVYQDFQGGGITNEELIGKSIAKHGRDKFIIATKWMGGGDRATIDAQLAQSLQRLGTDYIDLYYMHRMDPKTPIEDTMAVLKEYMDKGAIKYVGLSECTAAELARAHAVLPVSAIQMEWSLQTRDLEAEVVPMARKLGVGIVAYSPLNRGFLSRTFTKVEDLDAKDWRLGQPRFAPDNFKANEEKAAAFEARAKAKGCTPAQLAIAWVLARGDDVVPIPGTRKAARVEENLKSAEVPLTPEEATELAALVPDAAGERYGGGLENSQFNARQ